MSQNQHISVGEKRLFSINGELTIRIAIDEINLDLDYFDSFCFITNNRILMNDTDLVFYNNLKDVRGIVTEIELPDYFTDPGYDIELKINFNKLIPLDEKLEVYLRFQKQKTKKSVLSFLNKKNINESKIYISFSLMENNANHIVNGENYICNNNINDCTIIKLLEFTKIRNDLFELNFSSEFYDQNIEYLINSKLNKTHE